MKLMTDESGYVTTQDTGKGVKLAKALAVIAIIGSFFIPAETDPDHTLTALTMIAGVVTYIGAKIVGWWKYS